MMYSISNLRNRDYAAVCPTGVWDPFYRDLMLAAAAGVMEHTGCDVLRSLVRRNEITVVVKHPEEMRVSFDKAALGSLLVGVASAEASMLSESRVPFTCGSVYLFDAEDVVESYYQFLRRLNRNIAIQMCCTRLLRHVQKKTKKQTSSILRGMGLEEQRQLLSQHFGVDASLLPYWQKWGEELSWTKVGDRRYLYICGGLTMAEPYVRFSHIGEPEACEPQPKG